jgi:hypothetical protein
LSKVEASYTTPDQQSGADFKVVGSDEFTIHTQTKNGSKVCLKRESFIAAVSFLLQNGHISCESACQIGARIDDPSLLDNATRVHSGGTMVISYILPMLSKIGIIGINGGRPNSTWIKI